MELQSISQLANTRMGVVLRDRRRHNSEQLVREVFAQDPKKARRGNDDQRVETSGA